MLRIISKSQRKTRRIVDPIKETAMHVKSSGELLDVQLQFWDIDVLWNIYDIYNFHHTAGYQLRKPHLR